MATAFLNSPDSDDDVDCSNGDCNDEDVDIHNGKIDFDVGGEDGNEPDSCWWRRFGYRFGGSR